MNRRKLLQNMSLCSIIGLSGCVNRLNSTRNVDYNSDEKIVINITEEAQNPTLSQYELNFNTDIEKREADENGPPQVYISIENLSEKEIILTGKTRRIFGGETSESSNVVLLQSDNWSNSMIEDTNCFQLTQDIPRSGTQYETRFRPLEKNDIILDVLGNYTSNNCIPTGDYRFETKYELLVEDDMTGNYKVEEFIWGFILNISFE